MALELQVKTFKDDNLRQDKQLFLIENRCHNLRVQPKIKGVTIQTKPG